MVKQLVFGLSLLLLGLGQGWAGDITSIHANDPPIFGGPIQVIGGDGRIAVQYFEAMDAYDTTDASICIFRARTDHWCQATIDIPLADIRPLAKTLLRLARQLDKENKNK